CRFRPMNGCSDYLFTLSPPRLGRATRAALREGFARRTLRNIRPGSRGSLRLDAREPHHLGPLLGFRGDEAAKVGGRARNHCTAQIGKPRLDFGISKAGVDLLV